MRRLIVCIVTACAVVAPTVSVAPAKSGNGVMCVLQAKLAAKNETTGSTSTAKGHTLIKVRTDGTIEFKTHILNKNGETFIAGHIHQAPAGVAGAIVVPLFVAPAPPTSARHINQSGVATPNPGATAAGPGSPAGSSAAKAVVPRRVLFCQEIALPASCGIGW